LPVIWAQPARTGPDRIHKATYHGLLTAATESSTARYLPEKTTESIFGRLKQGIKFFRKQGSMEALIVLAFCTTAVSMPMRTYIPVFVKDVFHRGPETYGNLLSLMAI